MNALNKIDKLIRDTKVDITLSSESYFEQGLARLTALRQCRKILKESLDQPLEEGERNVDE